MLVELEFCLADSEPEHWPSELWETMSFNGDKFVADIVDALTKNQMTTLHLNWSDSIKVQFRDLCEVAMKGWQATVKPISM